ncbi:efflux RND transporter periplasmic adaptor subunit [Gammaproteobacteria bacterium]|nr:efflux RND transporter periplasmic adaptor subunit [Gammaproteobacteria bacterium]
MTKNIRISLFILAPILLWMISGFFVSDDKDLLVEKKDLFSVGTMLSDAMIFQPLIKLKATTESEARVNVRAKTSGEVVKIGAKQGQFVEKDFILCSLGVVELNRTEVKAPFSGYLEQIVKPGNFLERGQNCATIIQLDPITFVAEVPEFAINKIESGQETVMNLITGETVEGNLTFVSKSASDSTRTFKVESQVRNVDGLIRDGITSEMTIKTKKILAHQVSPSILILNDDGKLGLRSVKDNIVIFHEIEILEDSESGVWVSGLPDSIELIVQGQGFVENGQNVLTNRL